MSGISTELIAIVVACLAALLSFFAAREARRSASKAAEASASIALQQRDLQAHDLRLQYHSSIQNWAAESLQSLGRLIGCCHINPASNPDHHNAIVREINVLSALIDTGRWFFPNDSSTSFGNTKSPAFQGFRSPVLDQLVRAFNAGLAVLGADSSVADSRVTLNNCKREFTSLIQVYVQTDDWIALMNDIDQRAGKSRSEG